MFPTDQARSRRKFALGAVAVLCTLVGLVSDSTDGEVIAGAASGMFCMLVALHVASCRPRWNGAVPGLLGGMSAAVVGMGWRHVSSWSGLVGGIVAICAWIAIDKHVPAPGGSPATQ
ncbi:MAG: hypothetical protein LC749_09260 [Actinobacteria bacterium]|nr:hypothetical protein [Actinomycetota bacterium]